MCVCERERHRGKGALEFSVWLLCRALIIHYYGIWRIRSIEPQSMLISMNVGQFRSSESNNIYQTINLLLVFLVFSLVFCRRKRRELALGAQGACQAHFSRWQECVCVKECATVCVYVCVRVCVCICWGRVFKWKGKSRSESCAKWLMPWSWLRVVTTRIIGRRDS